MSEYYLQDTRTLIGNDMVFWAINHCGYTTDIRKAHVFSKEQAFKQHENRNSDKPWPKTYIDSKTRPAVDFQHVDYEVAMLEKDVPVDEMPEFKGTMSALDDLCSVRSK